MRTLIVDDEPLARARLKRLLNNHSGFECVGEASNGEDAIQMVLSLEPDLILLDIEMPLLNGLQVAERLNELALPPAIIFVTAYTEHALDAYRVGPSDYLVKPVDAERLSEALTRLGTYTKAHIEKQESLNPWLSFTLGGASRRIQLSQVLFFMADEKYVRMVFEGGAALIDLSLKQLEDQYGEHLLRIHRKTLVVKKRILSLSSQEHQHFIHLIGYDQVLDVSRRLYTKVRDSIQTR
ncbi:LytR/AlgR family response regulator transcription factor [Nitrincola alkalisediminis]|uniref:LytR/AlgR family response regulator transcription factor n=1 Tax=Nitrincola alkalisediminis TaxID=1366656 RepID=UPI0018738CAA|nr:LytTR family DNA-binding domain-containing protein [Nitrincola alkalisediminis]